MEYSSSKKLVDTHKKKQALKDEAAVIKNPNNSTEADDFENMATFGNMEFINPYVGIYDQALKKNIKEKTSALKGFQVDNVIEEIKQTVTVEDIKPKKTRSKRSEETRFSPYAIRERKQKIDYNENNVAKDTTAPLRRISQRLKDRPVLLLTEVSATEESSVDVESRKRHSGPVKMHDVVQETDNENKWMEEMKDLGKYLSHKKQAEENLRPMEKSWKSEIDYYNTAERCWSYPVKGPESLDKFKAKVSKLRMWCGSMARVLKERVTSIAVHPSKDCLLISAGGKQGTLGIWVVCPGLGRDIEDVKTKPELNPPSGINRFVPHTGLINCASFCLFGGDRLITSSYDGTVRSLNLERLVFDQLYASPEYLRNDWMQWHCQMSPNVLLVSQGTGNVYVLDDRSHREYEDILNCYDRSCRSVHIHPLQPQYLATSSSCGYASIWDLRKFKRKVYMPKDSVGGIKGIVNSDAAICHLGDEKRRLTSAFFSPVTGNGLLTTSSDDYVRVYDTSKLSQGGNYRVETGIRHNNRTGRWLTTFKAVWHPQRDDAFVIGSMAQPRQVEVFGRHGRLLASIGKGGPLPINTICSVNVFHPNRLVLASGDSSGRVHVFL